MYNIMYVCTYGYNYFVITIIMKCGYLNNYKACVIIAIPSSAINPKSHGYSIATISNRTLKEPVKMHYFGSRLSATSYNIKSSE